MIDAECEAALCGLIAERLGIALQPHQLGRLHACCAEAFERFAVEDCGELCARLRSAPADDPVLAYLVRGVTVCESHFFRDARQMALLERELLPALIARRRAAGNLTLRLWSAGCSEGQELYTLLLLLHRLLPDAPAWNLHLLGTDINVNALHHAMEGCYREWSMRGVDEALRAAAFERLGEGVGARWRLRRERFPAQLRFQYLNLAEADYPSVFTGTIGQDLILCRNVFIYFERPTVRAILERFARALADDGALIVGACDHVPDGVPGLRLVAGEEAFHFRRDAAAAPPEAPPATLAGLPYVSPLVPPPPPSAPPAKASDTLGTLLREAHALAGEGRLEEAEAAARRAVAHDDMAPDGHFLLALVALERDQPRIAEGALRRVLLLDREHALGHYQLGVLRHQQGRAAAAAQALQRAREIIARRDPAAAVGEYGDGMTYGHLAELVSHQLELFDE
ncbi:CheR family methyltransferase [Endothiovibrio diazotrophicus]